MVQVNSAKEIKGKAGHYLLLHGKSKSGKTTSLRTLKGKTMVIDADEGVISLDGQENIDYITVNESTANVIKEIKETLDYIEKHIDKYDNIVLDTLTALSKMHLDIFLAGVKDGRQAYGSLNTALYPILRKLENFARRKGKNVIIITQSEVSLDQEEKEVILPSVDGTKFVQKVILPRMDGILALEVDQLGNRKFITKQNGKWFAGVRDPHHILKPKENADFAELFDKLA